MKRFVGGFVLAFVLVSAYWAWPFVGLHAIAADVQARDSAALSKDVDFPSLARSLAEQIVTAYLRVTGKAAALGNFGAVLASAIGSSVADPLISQMINPENLTALLDGESVSTQFGPVVFTMGELPAISLSSLSTAWRAWLGTEYRLDHFSIALPVGAPAAEQYRLRLQLIQWHWKLTGMDLPSHCAPGSHRNWPRNSPDRVAR